MHKTQNNVMIIILYNIFCDSPTQMHIEAAKLLSFTEEEFVKALDWQAS